MECASSKAAPSSPAWTVRPSTTAVRTPLAGWAARRPVAPQPSLASAASAFRQGAGAVQVVELPKGRPWQRVLWAVLDDPASSKTANRVSAVMMSVIGVSVVNFCLASVPFNCSWEHGGKVNETVVNSSGTYVVEYLSYAPERRCDPVQPNAPIPFESVEMFCIILFTIEFMLRVAACPAGPGLVGFFTGAANIIDIVAIVPWYIELLIQLVAGEGTSLSFLSVLRIIRIFRVVRLFKFSKNLQGLMILGRTIEKSASALAMLIFFIAITLIVFSTLMYNVEGPGVVGSLQLGAASNVVYDNVTRTYLRPDGSPSPFTSILTTMWYCIVTMTTVGYGDATPVTVFGQICAMVLMLFSLIVLALPITIIGANFDEEYRDMRLQAMHARRQAMKDTQHAEKVAGQMLDKLGRDTRAVKGNALHKIDRKSVV